MTMLGAHLDDLTTLAQRLQTTSTAVGTTREQATVLSADVMAEVTAAAQRALDRVTSQMAELTGSVDAAVAQAETTQWTGANADRFRHAAGDFAAAMTSAGATTTESFASFQRSVHTMTETLDGFITSLSSALTDAEASAAAMASAVEAQRANLDQVMNAGLSVS